jgi:hypothetical protein
VEGVHCIVTGGGGYTLYGLVQREPLSQRFEPRFHHLVARISGDALQVQAVDRYGAVFDSFTIPRVSPPTLGAALVGPQTLRLRWNAAPQDRYHVEAAATAVGPFSTLEHPALPLTADDIRPLYLDLGGTRCAGRGIFRSGCWSRAMKHRSERLAPVVPEPMTSPLRRCHRAAAGPRREF